MPKLTHSDLSLAAQMIVDAYKSPPGEFKGFIIEGQLRSGKTAYSIKVMRDVFTALNPRMTQLQAYELALQHIHFEIEPFLQLVWQKQKEIREMLPKINWTWRIPILTLDDASLYAGTDLYFKDQAMYSAFQDVMTTIGSGVAGIIITAPAHESLTKCLREYYSYHVVEITKRDVWERDAKIKEWYRKPRSRKMDLREVGTDEFSAHIPTPIYAKYLAPRLQKGEVAVDGALTASREKAAARMEPKPPDVEKAAVEVVKPGPKSKKKKRRRFERPDELAHGKLLR